MTEFLDMSLDDIIKNNKKSSSGSRSRGRSVSGAVAGTRTHGRSRGRGSDSGLGPTRRTDTRTTTRSNPYFVPQAFHVQKMLVGGKPNSDSGTTKLYISNLNYQVTNEDIKVLFSDVGELKRYSLHYDRSGRSKGTAEVEYIRQTDAVSAMKRYNNVQLDGKPMKLELVGVNIVTHVPIAPMQKGILGNNPSYAPRSGIQGRIVGRGQQHGGNVHRGSGTNRDGNVHRGSGTSRDGNVHPGSGTSRGGDHGRPKKVSAEDLDADLERYRLQAMDIN